MRRMTPTEKLVHNERLKLRANALNTLGTSYFTIGALAPLVNLTFGSPAHTQPWYIYVLFLVSFSAGGIRLHKLGQQTLNGLIG
ncbi:hypothetical protein APT_02054 [Acetobacter pasteurianus NBRC 101655]|uniref:Amino acid transporter n=1 Tax=Acetobacter pasteurianus NBRC 3188 TaxID=1226663 RepID=A0A401WUH1_ACEPA|nr:hypothetical protein APT_02054 [Acetobacter pasteurianus NBRC 101655]GCD52967.1 hypothetical protein NBRC3188_1664 [Acetobacter pasteurianus NBRC 3188]